MSTPDELYELFLANSEVPLSGDFGDITVSLDEEAKPLWHGKVEFGTLTIYRATISGEPNYPIVSFFHVLQDAKILGLDKGTDAAYTVYHKKHDIRSVVINLIQDIKERYMSLVETEICDRKFDGTYQLQ